MKHDDSLFIGSTRGAQTSAMDQKSFKIILDLELVADHIQD